MCLRCMSSWPDFKSSNQLLCKCFTLINLYFRRISYFSVGNLYIKRIYKHVDQEQIFKLAFHVASHSRLTKDTQLFVTDSTSRSRTSAIKCLLYQFQRFGPKITNDFLRWYFSHAGLKNTLKLKGLWRIISRSQLDVFMAKIRFSG